nr:peptidylprolyl isomerase [Clostridia bacterium]
SSSDLAQTMSTDADGKTTTYYDYLIATTATQLQRIYAEASLAREAGLTLGEYQASVDSQIESIITSAGSAGYADMMLKQAYGPGCTLGAVRELYENLYLSNKYSETKTGEADVSAEALNAYYTENMDTIDQVTYRAFSFSFSVSSTATAAEKEQAKTAAKTKADAFLADVGSEKDFQELALAATAEDDRDTYKEKDGSLIKGRTYSGLTTPVGDWAFDKARKAGDTSVLENTTDYTVVYFIKREKPENLQASVRHILIAAKRDSATEAELAQAKATAETILAEITDEASFIERVRTYSEDVPSIGDGGLYTGLDENSSYVTEFLDWAVDETRKVGDTGIVQTDYGYHVMFFSGRTPAWENTVRTILQDDAYEEFISDKLVNDARFNYTLNSFAMRFVI